MKEIEKNRAAYDALREELEANPENIGKVALLHKGKLISILNDSGDAYTVGVDRFGLGNFYVKVIGEAPASLGVHTMCIVG